MKTKSLKGAFILAALFFTVQASAQKIVLYEQFSNASCPICATWSPQVHQFVQARDTQALLISYHTNFPYNDGIYLENPDDVNARVAYYNVQGTPWTVMEGSLYNGASSSFIQGNPSNSYNTRVATASDFEITFSNVTILGNRIRGTAHFKSLISLNGETVKAHIVAAEKLVLKSSYPTPPGTNSETQYPYVMRKMYPSAAGSTITALNSGNITSTLFDMEINNARDLGELQIIAFVQNETTKEVYQAAKVQPQAYVASEAPRMVLFEQFSNASCPTCATWSPQVHQFIEARDTQALLISYHTNFPYNDGIYAENPDDVNSRVAYYNVQGTPWTVVDGNLYNGGSASYIQNNPANNFNTKASIAPGFDIQVNNLVLTGNQLSGTVVYTSLGNNAGKNIHARIAAVEQLVLKSSYPVAPGTNAETQYPFVMRKMYPDAGGTALTQLDSLDTESISFTITINNARDLNDIALIAYAQDESTKEVYQSAKQNPQIVSGITNNNGLDARLFYNSLSSTIVFQAAIDGLYHLKVYAADGRQVISKVVESDASVEVPSLAQGVYLVEIVAQNGDSRKVIRFAR
ncbi:MAG: T9SS type A sorting domain-containing protein [Chitinophagales bacterium]|nr:T9SS type A sorting domain-containing protein [Chitinophagales bacterium]